MTCTSCSTKWLSEHEQYFKLGNRCKQVNDVEVKNGVLTEEGGLYSSELNILRFPHKMHGVTHTTSHQM